MSSRIAVILSLATVSLLAGCGKENTGGTDAKPTSSCTASTCTVTFPAKARNNQASMGGTGLDVFGVSTALAEIAQGEALLKIGPGSISVAQGETATSNGLTVKVISLSETQAVVSFTKT